MRVKQVDLVSVPTRDVARTVAWYRDVLGLRGSEYADGEVETPNVTLGFWNLERDGFIRDPDGNVLILHRRYAPRRPRGQG